MQIKSKTNLRNAVILLGSTMSVMAGASISPALPEMKEYFSDIPSAEILVKIMLTVPSLFIALFSPFAGKLLDKIGRKPLLIFATVLYGIAGTSGFFLDNLYLILIGRAFLGIAVAVIMTGYITVIGDLFSAERLNKFFGIQAAFMSFGGVLFLAVGGLLADIQWHYPFLIYLFAFLILPGLFIFLKETKKKTEQKKKVRLFPKELFHKKIQIYFLAFLTMAVFLMITVQLPFLLKETSQISNSNIGFLMALWILFSALTSLFYKNIKSKFSYYLIFSIAFIIWGIAYIGLALTSNYLLIILCLILSGIGNGLTLPNIKVLLISSIKEEFRGRAVGVLTMGFYFGQFFSPILFSLVIFNATIQAGFLIWGSILLALSIFYAIYNSKIMKLKKKLY